MTTAQNRKFIYLENFYDKKNGEKELRFGKHIVFPKIIVDKTMHQVLIDKLIINIEKNNKFELTGGEIKAIVDQSVGKGNGMRLPYFKNKGCYYAPNEKISTYKKMDYSDKIDVIKKNLIRTNSNCTNIDLKFDLEDFIEDEGKNKKKNGGDKKKSTDMKMINDTVNKICENWELVTEIDKNYARELIKILPSEKYLNQYDSWLRFVFLCKRYGLYQECIEKSKECKGYDKETAVANAKEAIDGIFKNNRGCASPITLGSLSRWCKESNKEEYKKLRKKYNIEKNKLNFSDVSLESILNYKNELKADYVEKAKYISEDAKKVIYDRIKTGKTRFLILHSPPGTGKTTVNDECMGEYLKKAIDKMFKDKVSILSMVNRRTIATSHETMFKNVKLHNYLEFHKFQNRYISSIEHLLFLERDEYDIVILDEVLSLINYFKSSTLNGRRKECLRNLIMLIYNAKLVIASDASVNSIVSSFLNIHGVDDEGNKKYMVEPSEIFYYKNEFKNKQGVKLNIFNSDFTGNYAKMKYVVEKNMDKILQFKRGIIFSDSKAITNKLKEMIDRRIEVYLRDKKTYTKMKGKYKDHVVLINADFCDDAKIGKYDENYGNKFVIASPKITAGVDIITIYEEIDAIYIKTSTNFGMCPFDYHQQISRTRDVGRVNIFNMDVRKFQNYYSDYDRNKNIVDNEIKHFKKNLGEMIGKFESDMCSTFPLDPQREGYSVDFGVFYKDINYYQTWFNRIFNMDKLQVLSQICENDGYEVEYCESDREELKRIDKELKEDNKKMKRDNKKKIKEFEKNGIEIKETKEEMEEDEESAFDEWIQNELEEELNREEMEEDNNENVNEGSNDEGSNDESSDDEDGDDKGDDDKGGCDESKKKSEEEVISYDEYLDLIYQSNQVKYNKLILKKLLYGDANDLPDKHFKSSQNNIYGYRGKLGFLTKDYFQLFEDNECIVLNMIKTIHDFSILKKVVKCDEIIDIIANEKYFDCLRCNYYMSFEKDEFQDYCKKVYKKELDEVFMNQKLLNQINALFNLEDLIGIKRYCIDDLPENLDEIELIKNELGDNLDKIYGLYKDNNYGTVSYKRYVEREKKRINNIEYINDLVIYVVDSYNSISKIFTYEKNKLDKIGRKGARTQKTIYSKIKFYI